MKSARFSALKRGLFYASAVCVLYFTAVNRIHANDIQLWDSLKSGQAIALMRHALAPGTSDPAGFNLDDCSSQRLLSDAGQDQARRIGLRFKQNGINNAHVFSSQWCRCLDTAALLELGEVKPLALLNSFFQNPQRREPQTQKLKSWITQQSSDQPIVLVTHQVNITAVSGVFPTSGETVFIQMTDDQEIEVLGTIKTD